MSLLTSTFVGLCLLVTADAHAEIPQGQWRTVRVGVLPLRSYSRAPEDLFTERAELRLLRERAGAWQRWIEESLSARDQLEVVPAQEVSHRLRQRQTYRDKLAVAQERFALGLQHYRRLELGPALTNLDRARELYSEAKAFITESTSMADVALYRGLVFMEQGDLHRAHISFREMWQLDPRRRFDQGYYTAATEAAMGSALLDLTSLASSGATLPSREALYSLARTTGTDIWVIPSLIRTLKEPSGGSASKTGSLIAELRLVIFDASTRTFSLDERVPLRDEAWVMERLDRLLSSWQCCVLTVDEPIKAREPSSAIYVDIAPTYGLFLKHDRTRASVHSPGGSVAVMWEATPSFLLFAQANHVASLPDRNRDLLEAFVTSRFTVGAGLGASSRRGSVFARAGLEMAVTLSDIEMTNDVDCKHFGSDHPRCNGVFTLPSSGAWLGLSFGVGARWLLGRGWYLQGATDLTSYILTRELVADLNFPLTFTAGVGRRFGIH
ncbi:MAG: hypothetical protein VYE15_06105 [Myxococcota bacterium]|nr:hypothetical protein [Myxococcota bacterium]